MKYVIIGNSTAAVGTVEGIRKVDKKSEITIISSESHHTYSRPLISYMIEGKTDENRMKYRPDSFYDDNKCKTIFSKTVVSIDKENKYVVLDNGKTVKYDKLMVATGSRPFIPPTDGYDDVVNKFSFMSLDDAKALSREITPKSKVLIIGGGLIGLKCAEAIAEKVEDVFVVDLSDHILPSILDKECSEIVQKELEKHGIKFTLGCSVKKYSPSSALLSNGDTIDFDILVTAVGVRPNTSLVADIGGNVGRGIKINEFMETSIKDIYSAGDCTESFDISFGSERILAILPNAYMQGECAGVNMAGGEKKFENAIPMNSIGFFGFHIMTAGSYTGECIEKNSEGNIKRFYVSEGLLKGYMLIGEIEKGGIYTSLIRNKVPLDSIDFEEIMSYPTLSAFSLKNRSKMLGGVV